MDAPVTENVRLDAKLVTECRELAKEQHRTLSGQMFLLIRIGLDVVKDRERKKNV